MTLRADNEARTTIEIITEFLAAIFEGTQEPKFFQTLANDAGDADEAPNKKSILTREVASIERFVARYDRNRRGLFFCVSTIAKGSSTRNKDNCREITVAHTDLDFRSIAESEVVIRLTLASFPVPPSIVVFSGGGLHLYWLLKEPLPAQQYRERLEALNRKLASVLAGDLQATDVCRLMRLPGTTNSKHGDQRKVVVEKLDAAFRYDFDELEEAVAGLRPLLTAKEAAPAKEKTRQTGGVSSLELDAKGDPEGNPFLKVAEEQGWKPPLDVAQALASMTYPGNVHETQIRVAASMAKAGVSQDEVVALVLEATMNAPGVDVAKWDWRGEEKRICDAYASAVAKFDIAPANVQANAQAAAVSRETPKTTASVAGKGAPIGAVEVGNVVPFTTGKKRKAANAQAMHIVLANNALTVLEDRGYRLMFTERGGYVYETGLWTLRDDKDLTGWLNAYLEDSAQQGLKLESTTRLINEARAYIIRQPRLQGRGTMFDRHGKVPTLSGLVDPRTGKIEPCLPEHFCTWQIPFHYDPEAKCPRWLQMLGDMFADRPLEDRQLHIRLLQEMLGMGMVDDRSKHLSLALIFQGNPDAGKSDAIDVMAGLFGPNVNPTPLDDLDKTHGTMAFAKRVPWVLHEAFEQAKWHMSGTVKSIISLDGIRINMKGGRIFEHRPTGPIFWGTNPVPQFKESSGAIVSRIVVVACRQKFDKKNPVGVALLAKQAGLAGPSQLILKTEMEGVLAWAFAGLQRALKRGYFIQPKDSEEIAGAIREDSNIVIGFMGCVDFNPNGRIRVADFEAAHSAWWKERKRTDRGTPSGDSITKALKALGEPRIAFGLKDNRYRYYCGMWLNEEGMAYWKHTVNSNSYDDHAKKASTHLPDEHAEVNQLIPPAWDGKPAIFAMQAAHTQSVTSGDRDGDNDFPGDRPLGDSGDSGVDLGDTF